MKRSEINTILRQAKGFLAEHRFHLPPFAAWTPEQWRTKGPEAQEIAECQLGWDITDFGSGNFRQCGLFLFTVRNGRPANFRPMQGKVYAEKIMIVEVGQVTPLHFHWQKTEDIINRGGGKLVVQLYNSTRDEQLAGDEITVSLDGVTRQVPAGGKVTLGPGESITLPPRLYHAFWGEGSRVLVGEVSMVNDDRSDNRFHKPVGRFPQITEDEPPLHLLTVDYPNYYRRAG
ncbi:MAG: D-lyxose/D-mannose family sugar isomerase [Opitutaceae bacterium]|nr:D-lyxose/D-mannose family sugar isomerase [Opitutaceae bacterium]